MKTAEQGSMRKYHAQSPKREKRRQQREKEFGPERRIVSSCGEAHVLECGHRVLRMATELPHIKRRRCEHCREPSLAREINVRLGDIDGDGLPFACPGCGATRSIGPVFGVPGVRGECRECPYVVSEVDADSLAKARKFFAEASEMEDGGVMEIEFGAEPGEDD